MLGGHFSAGLLDQRNVLAGALDEDFVLAILDGLGIDQFAAHGDRAGTGAEEVGSGIEIDSAGWCHFDLRERTFEGLDVLGATDVAAGEDFDDVGTGVPGSGDFGGGKCAGKNDFGVTAGHLDRLEVERGSYKELGTREHADAAGFRVEDGARSQGNFVAELGGDRFKGFDRAGDGHRNFGCGDAAFVERFDRADGGFGGGRADDGYDADREEVGEDLMFRHCGSLTKVSLAVIRNQSSQVGSDANSL